MFKVLGLSVGLEKKPVLQDVSFDIEQGECVALMGQNGAGKSTLCKCLLGIIPQLQSAQVEGQVLVGGVPTTSQGIGSIGRRVGFTLENPEAQFVSLSVAEEVALTLAAHGREVSEQSIGAALDCFGIVGLLERDTRTLSEGEKRRVTLAALEGAQPEAMVLDEPTTALDSAGQLALIDFLNRARLRGCTTLFSTHNMEVAERSALRFLGLRDGTLVADRTIPTNSLMDEKVFPGLNAPLEPPPSAVPFASTGDAVIETHDLAFSHPHGGKALFKDINLQLRSGDVLVVRGANGSGKTTLLYLLSGLLRPSEGVIRISGRPPRQIPMQDRSKICGLVFQNPEHQILMNEVNEEILCGVAPGQRADRELVERLEWIRRVLAVPQGARDPHTLSLGQKKILALATVLVPRPQLLLLDEPELGLDPVQKLRMAQVLEMARKHWGMAMILTTHDGDIVQRLSGVRTLDLDIDGGSTSDAI